MSISDWVDIIVCITGLIAAVVTCWAAWFPYRVHVSSRKDETPTGDPERELDKPENGKGNLKGTVEQLEREKAGLAEELKISRAETERIRNDPKQKVLVKALKPLLRNIRELIDSIEGNGSAHPSVYKPEIDRLFETIHRNWEGNLVKPLSDEFSSGQIRKLRRKISDRMSEYYTEQYNPRRIGENGDPAPRRDPKEAAQRLYDDIKKLEDWSP